MAKSYTLEEVAEQMGVSRERIRQIEVAALKKCRRWCRRHDYNLNDLLPGADYEEGPADEYRATSWDNW